MTEPKHTPGPWEDTGGCIIAPVGDRDNVHGECDASIFGNTPEEAQANACLIAAAPELLKAIKGLLNAQSYGIAKEGWNAAAKAALDIIDKAEGRDE